MEEKRPIEPFLWLLFSAGGTLAALLMPVLVFLFGLAFPLGLIQPPSYEHLMALIGHPLSRLGLLALVALGLLHWAHRFRYTLYDGLQITRLNDAINVSCYGAAAIGSLVAAYLLATF